MKKILFGVATLGLIGLAGAGIGLKTQDTVETKAGVETAYSGIYLAGSMNDWLQNKSEERSPQIVNDLFGDKYQFSYVGQNNEGKHLYTLTVTLESGTFKIWDYEHENKWVNYWNTENISDTLLSGGNTSDNDAVNITLSKSGTYTVIYAYADWNDKQILSFVESSAGDEIDKWCADFLNDTADICATGTENDDHSSALRTIWKDDATEASTIYVRGTFNGWADVDKYQLKRVGTSSVYRLSNVFLVKDAEFKARTEADVWYPAGDNIKIVTPGWYYIELDTSAGTLNHGLRKYLADSFGELSDEAKSLFKPTGDSTVVEAYTRYVHIVKRYSLDNFADAVVSSAYTADTATYTSSNSIIAPVIITATASLMGIGAVLFARKRRAE